MQPRIPLNASMLERAETLAVAKFSDDYSTFVSIFRYDPTTASDSVYGESISKRYLPAVSMLAKVKLSPDEKTMQSMGIAHKVDAVFIFSQRLLTAQSITLSDKDVLSFKNVQYAIDAIKPIGQIQDKNFFIMVLAVNSPEEPR